MTMSIDFKKLSICTSKKFGKPKAKSQPRQGWRKDFSDGGADSSDEGAKIWFSGYNKCQKSPKNHVSPSEGG